jgi:AAA family ATP:ADP antiporter
VPRLKLIAWVTAFFIAQLIAFYFLGKAGVREGIVFYIWVGIFNVFVVAQFWAFANDLFGEAQGKRLFPIVGAGGSFGALLGAWGATQLLRFVGPYGLLFSAAAGITICIILTAVADRWAAKQPDQQASSKSKIPLGKEGGFELILRDRYLLLVATLTVLLNVVNTSGEFMLGKLLVERSLLLFGTGEEMARKAFVAEFYAQFFTWVNLLGLVLQLLLVSRIFRYIGIRGSLFVLPTIALSGYSLILLYSTLSSVRLFKILENSTDYSVQNTARQALFLPTSREAKYKAKAAVDTFFMRIGDVLLAGIVFVGTKLALTISGFAAISVIFIIAWIAVTLGIYREHKRRIPGTA